MYGKLEARRLGSLQRKAERPVMTKDRRQRDEKRSKVGEGEGKLYLKSESGAARWWPVLAWGSVVWRKPAREKKIIMKIENKNGKGASLSELLEARPDGTVLKWSCTESLGFYGLWMLFFWISWSQTGYEKQEREMARST
jgi:hypothetical protein